MNIEDIASNIRGGTNPPYTVGDFKAMYPAFADVPLVVLQTYVDMAQQSILESRWHSKWKLAIGLYIAHFVTLWARTASTDALGIPELAKAGESKGSVMSKSVDGVSVSYGATSADNDLVGWGSFRDTLYGQQLATLARIVGYTTMYVT